MEDDPYGGYGDDGGYDYGDERPLTDPNPNHLDEGQEEEHPEEVGANPDDFADAPPPREGRPASGGDRSRMRLPSTVGAGVFTNLGDVPMVESPGAEKRGRGYGDEEGESGDSEDFDLPPPTTIQSVRNHLGNVRFAKYLQEFDFDAADDGVIMASVPSATIDEGNRAQLLAAGIQREDEEMRHLNDLDHIDLLRARRVHEIDLKKGEKNRMHHRNLRDLAVKASLTEELLGTYFDHTSQELDIHLTARQAEVMQSVGEVRKFDRGDYDPDKPDWSTFEQQVEFRVDQIRGTKDKIPKGEYIMLISKWDKFGGNPMRWSNKTATSRVPPPCPLHSETRNMRIRKSCEICNGWAGSTMPVYMRSRAKDFETSFESKTFTFFPSQRNIKPYMVLMFELVRLPDKRKGEPKVVGWGALPCVDTNFQVINGKFRFPLMRGSYDPQRFRHHESIRTTLSDDIENWLGNCYIDVFPHPREHYGRHEFQLQAEFTNGLLRLNDYPASKDADGWPVDEKKRGASFMASNVGMNSTRMAMVGGMMVSMRELGIDEDANDFPYTRPENIEYHETAAKTNWGIIRSAVLDTARARKRAEQERQRQAVLRAEQKKQYRFSIHPEGATNMQSVWRTQVEYSMRAILDEMSLRRGTRRFIINIISFFIALYVQVYTHSVFTYFSLYAFDVPVEAAVPEAYGLLIQYSQLNTTALQELAVVFIAQMANYMVLLVLIFVGWALERSVGMIPEHLSKFVYTISLGVLTVPWIELLIDGSNGTSYSDIMRLHNYFSYHQYGAFYGYIIFALVYLLLYSWTLTAVFMYTMRLHLNGILQDAYWRILEVNDENFFIPEDLELSQRELMYILEKAERWRGKNGERRKVAVYNIKTTDTEDEKFERVDQYIAIFQMDCGNSAEFLALGDHKPMRMHRQFYVMHDGAILESISRDLPNGMAFVLASLNKGGGSGAGGAFGKLLASAFKHAKAEKQGYNPFADIRRKTNMGGAILAGSVHFGDSVQDSQSFSMVGSPHMRKDSQIADDDVFGDLSLGPTNADRMADVDLGLDDDFGEGSAKPPAPVSFGGGATDDLDGTAFGDANPFAGEADPFAGGADPFKDDDEKDPFADSDEDAGGAAGPSDDPFADTNPGEGADAAAEDDPFA